MNKKINVILPKNNSKFNELESTQESARQIETS